jgi:hypothetical protein
MSYTLKNNFMRDFTRGQTQQINYQPLIIAIKLIRDPVKLAKLHEYICDLAETDDFVPPKRVIS